ncbi:sperm microtubule associated protein 2-like isoform X2 [Dasypus novemcinctus]|uniref:sperm microtubule associated protein 2-like isoform X2 n=1 Tax=Dasypus novemcinctus TaxID=9361 RepID=UPI00265F54B8|nr:testicular haploid expressed gene protein-like isoform X2 [Dasypus novemcinctus]
MEDREISCSTQLTEMAEGHDSTTEISAGTETLQGPLELSDFDVVDESEEPEEPEEREESEESQEPEELEESVESDESTESPAHLELREPPELAESHPRRGPRPCPESRPRRPSRPRRQCHEAAVIPCAAMISPSLVSPCPPRILPSSRCDAVSCDFVRKCSFSRKRIQELSRSKKQRGTPDIKLFWGNQDPIRPVSQGALKAQLTKRLEDLAQPKKVSYKYVPNRSQYYYSCGRESVIWEIPRPALFSLPSKRIQKLAQPRRSKQEHPSNSDNLIKYSLQIPDPSPRILRLSKVKGIDPNYVPPKDIETKISSSVLGAIATPRIVDLAQPRLKIEGLCYERENSEMPIRPVTTAALQASPSPRITALAKCKPLHQDYLPIRDVRWPVSHAAIHSKASPRIQELANPNTRTSVHITYYDPGVFTVKPAAMTAQCSPRIRELAEPLIR